MLQEFRIPIPPLDDAARAVGEIAAGSKAAERSCDSAQSNCSAAIERKQLAAEAVSGHDVQRIQHRRSLPPRPARRPGQACRGQRRPGTGKPATAAAHKGLGWRYVSPAPTFRASRRKCWSRPWLREALIRLNPEIAAQPDRADEVLYKLRAIVLSVRSDGLVQANEEFDRLAARRALDALRPEQRARRRPPDRLRRPRAEPVRRHPAVHLPRRQRPRRAPTWCCWSTASRWC